MDLAPRKQGKGGDWSLASLQRDMNRLFENFLGSGLSIEPFLGQGWCPAIDISETTDAVVVKAELPGVEPGNVEVSLAGNSLTIKGEKKEEKEEEDRSYHRVERSYGSFSRSIEVPSVVDPDKITARFDKGVLEITMTKKEGEKGKKIEVKTE